ncbi:MAG: threonine--tRNA ligase [Thermoproteota archaeon]|nr:MAG: threonine--tRNA ligase [Candidatus Korarchaeota archaeon]
MDLRIYCLHSDKLSYEVKEKAVKEAEEVKQRSYSIEEVLVLFTSYERDDDASCIDAAVEDIKTVAGRLSVTKLALYPWVHLTEKPAPFLKARELHDLFSRKLREAGFEVHKVPIGWYKAFEIKVKGHPLAESLRVIRGVREVKREKEVVTPSEFIILYPSGKELKVEGWKQIEDEDLRIFVRNEVFGKPPSGRSPVHIELMRRLELIDYEPASDVGHFRFYPEGTLVKRLIEELAFHIANKIGAMEIETPLIYRLTVPAIAEQAEKFRERGYRFEIDNVPFTLRFAGDFGLFEMMKDMIISKRHLPLSFYEISPSFRLEQRGECVGLRRLRGFTMPDIHTFAADIDQALEVYKLYFKEYDELLRRLEIDYVVAFRVVKEYYERFKPHILEMLRHVNKPALIEILPKMKHYWAMKHEFQFIDKSEGNGQLSTVQLDVEDSARYGIYYVAEDGEKKPGIIIHTSMGSIERMIYAILEQAAKSMEKGVKPMLPLWLSPVQVRVFPITERAMSFAEEVVRSLRENEVRADLDDRDISLAKKVREAERRWIPYLVFIGEKELEKKGITVRRRRDGAEYFSTVDSLRDEIKAECNGMPYRPLNVPYRLSKRPRFVGAL